MSERNRYDNQFKLPYEGSAAALNARNQEAFTDLVITNYDKAMSFTARVVDSLPDADQIVNDGFLRMWKHIDSLNFDPHTNGAWRNWFYSTLTNLSRDYFASKQYRTNNSNVYLADDFQEDTDSSLASAPEVQENSFETVEYQLAIEQILKTIPADQGKAISMHYLEDLDPQEIANITGEALGTIRSRIRLGLAKLRESMAKGKLEAYGY